MMTESGSFSVRSALTAMYLVGMALTAWLAWNLSDPASLWMALLLALSETTWFAVAAVLTTYSVPPALEDSLRRLENLKAAGDLLESIVSRAMLEAEHNCTVPNKDCYHCYIDESLVAWRNARYRNPERNK